ncbi:hypothetical protein HDU67_006401 [Dinochytrium kinnereticum]|nr:hypothetical protein HDU67_006401 [Dinochytrium kinnereticum]
MLPRISAFGIHLCVVTFKPITLSSQHLTPKTGGLELGNIPLLAALTTVLSVSISRQAEPRDSDRAFCKPDLPPPTANPSTPPPKAPTTAAASATPETLPGAFPADDAKKDEKKDERNDEKKEEGKPASPKAATPSGPKFFILHDNFFFLRQNEKKKKASVKEKEAKLNALRDVVVPKKAPGGLPGYFPR